MPYYRQVGDVPRKRHTQFRRPDGGPVRRGADGRRGLLLRRVAALPPAPADRDRVQRGLRRADLRRRPTTRSSRGTSRRTSSDGAPAADRCSAGSTCWPTPTSGSSYVVADRPSPLYRNAIGDECVYVESGAASSRPCSAPRRSDRRLRRHPDVDTHRWVPQASCGCWSSRRPATSAAAALPVEQGAVPRARARTASATCAARPSRCARREDVEVLVQHRGRRVDAATSTRTTRSTSSGWDGCLYPYAFSIHDFEPITGGCTSRRRCTRRSRGRTS
jgi:homogentisate 1,2-dioxygenase